MKLLRIILPVILSATTLTCKAQEQPHLTVIVGGCSGSEARYNEELDGKIPICYKYVSNSPSSYAAYALYEELENTGLGHYDHVSKAVKAIPSIGSKNPHVVLSGYTVNNDVTTRDLLRLDTERVFTTLDEALDYIKSVTDWNSPASYHATVDAVWAPRPIGIEQGFITIKEKKYWVESSIVQGTMDDPKNVMGDGTPRGREIYDPDTDAWYWLDSIYYGAAAFSKEVWLPYIYQDECDKRNNDDRLLELASECDEFMQKYIYSCMKSARGKWVRYDNEGKMLKGWVTIEGDLAQAYPSQAGNTYYYDTKTGTMAKGTFVIEGIEHHFDRTTGVLLD